MSSRVLTHDIVMSNHIEWENLFASRQSNYNSRISASPRMSFKTITFQSWAPPWSTFLLFNRHTFKMTKYPEPSAEKPFSSGEFHANMSIEAGTEIAKFNSPVHETMTIAALIASDFKIDRNITIYKLKDNPKAYPEINDFIRGVIWNDDPACELFDDNDNNDNFDYSTGATWLTYFLRGKYENPFDEHNIIGRSHFGDLQFLHGMAAEKGEWPTDTRNNIMNYLELMYKLACGNVEVKSDTEIKNTWLGRYFTAFSTPDKFYELRGLLTAYHKTPANVRHRALGSCFHLIQDSYTHGHTRRLLKNPQDQDTSSRKSDYDRCTCAF